jgi:hypothetical protein
LTICPSEQFEVTPFVHGRVAAAGNATGVFVKKLPETRLLASVTGAALWLGRTVADPA